MTPLQTIREAVVNSISRATISVQDGQEIKFPDWQDWLHLEILGRPIQLADVLRAIGNMLIIVDANGNFYRMSMKLSDKVPKLAEHLGHWNLSLPLDSQSPETLQFLAEILK